MLKKREANSFESGSTIVEFAIVLPLILLLLFGLIDFGRMGFIQVSITSASREGARLSSFYQTTNSTPIPPWIISTNDLETLVKRQVIDSVPEGIIDTSLITVTSCTDLVRNTEVKVVVEFTSSFGYEFPLTSTSYMRCVP